MELKGERTLPVDRATAWKELNDPAALQAAVPGCEAITPLGDDRFEVSVNAAVGPVKARFKGKLQIADAVPPAAYTIRFDMQGGSAGFSRGDARVELAETGPRTTLMRYTVNASIGGKVAQIGSRLVDAAAGAMADKFFATFAVTLATKYPAPVEAGAPPAPPPAPPGFVATLLAFFRRLFGR